MLALGNARQSIFQQDWWLEAASLGRFETVETIWDGVTVGRLSYQRKRRLGIFTLVGMPSYTRTLGPVLSLPQSKPVQREINARRIIGDLVGKLPRHDRFFQLLDPFDNNGLAFALSGCVVKQEFTFRTAKDYIIEHVYDGIHNSTRRLIKKWENECVVDYHYDIERFIQNTPHDHGVEDTTHDFVALRRIFEAAHTRRQTVILTAQIQNGNDLGSVILIWDDEVLYYWLPQRDRSNSGGGTNALLVWKAISYAANLGLTMDFDSYRSVGTARFLTTFGLSPVGRTAVTHESIISHARNALRRHPKTNGFRADSAVSLSFHNARTSSKKTT